MRFPKWLRGPHMGRKPNRIWDLEKISQTVSDMIGLTVKVRIRNGVPTSQIRREVMGVGIRFTGKYFDGEFERQVWLACFEISLNEALYLLGVDDDE